MDLSCLPEGQEKTVTQSNYWNTKQFEAENKMRIVIRPICGWIDWDNKKPLRFRPENKPPKPVNPEFPIKAFWALYVWDYKRKDLFIVEFTQSTIIQKLKNLALDQEWGNFLTYDIKVKKTGKDKETTYDVIPSPHTPIAEEIKIRLKEVPVRLEALYEGGDPWSFDWNVLEERSSSKEILTESQVSELEFYCSEDPRAAQMLMERFNIETIYDLPFAEYARSIQWLVSRKEAKNGNVA